MLKQFKLIGIKAHTNPKKGIDFTEVIFAKDIVDAYLIYKHKLRGVKHKANIDIKPI